MPLEYQVLTTGSSIMELPFAVNSMNVQVVGDHTVAFFTEPSGQIHKVSSPSISDCPEHELYYSSVRPITAVH